MAVQFLFFKKMDIPLNECYLRLESGSLLNTILNESNNWYDNPIYQHFILLFQYLAFGTVIHFFLSVFFCATVPALINSSYDLQIKQYSTDLFFFFAWIMLSYYPIPFNPIFQSQTTLLNTAIPLIFPWLIV